MFIRPRPRPVLTGLVVGGAVASNRAHRRQMQRNQMALEQQVAEANMKAAQAQEDAARAQKAASEAKPAPAAPAATASTVSDTISVDVPQGVSGGSQFMIQYQGGHYNVTCPYGVQPGQTIKVTLPNPQKPQTSAVAYNMPASNGYPAASIERPPPSAPTYTHANPAATASVGKALLQETLESPIAESGEKLILTRDHHVDENSATMKAHNIISADKGEVVELVHGSLEAGLGGSYKDYVEVRRMTGKQGKVSRFVVQPLIPSSTPSGPPPAISG